LSSEYYKSAKKLQKEKGGALSGQGVQSEFYNFTMPFYKNPASILALKKLLQI
jgi:hypothetical protein